MRAMPGEQAQKDAKACWKTVTTKWPNVALLLGPELLRALLRSEIVSLAQARADAGGGTGSYAWMDEVARYLDSEYLGGGS